MDIQNLPLTIRRIDRQDIQVHDTIWPQLIFVLSGTIQIQLNNIVYTLHPSDLIMINAFDYYACSHLEGESIILTFYTNLLPGGLDRYGEKHYECLPGQEDPEALGYLKHAVFSCLKHYMNGGTLLTNITDTLLIFDILQKFFSIDDRVYQSPSFSHVRAALSYIGKHYEEHLTMKEVADTVGCSPNYFSTIFKDTMGVSFTEYLNDFRLTYAFEEIIHTKYSLASIAEKTGFASDFAMSKAFRKKYGMLPGAFRKAYHEPEISDETLIRLNEDLLTRAQDAVADTAKSFKEERYQTEQPERKVIIIDDPLNKRKSVEPNHIFTIFPRCNLSDLTNIQSQRRISEFQSLCHFEYIKIPGIFSESLHICMAVRNREVICQFDRLDLIINFVLENHLKPIIDLGGMPQVLAKKEKYIRFFGYDLGAPKDNELWADLVSQTIEHLCLKYTDEQVASWRFVSWAEPEFVFFNVWPDRESFFEFYGLTVETVRKVNPLCKIGTPPFDAHETAANPDFFCSFMTWCSKHGCLPDFIQVSFYPEERSISVRQGQAQLKHFPLNSMDSGFDEFVNVLTQTNASHIPLIIKEYGNTRAQSVEMNDTIHGAALLAGLCRVLAAKSIPMTLSGFIETPIIQSQVSHAFWGANCLMTSAGIKKASWYMVVLMAKLGKDIIYSDDYCMVTRQDGHLAGMISYAARPESVENVSLELDDDVGFWPVETSRIYQERVKDRERKAFVMEINIGGLTGENYKIREYVMDSENCCAYRQWQYMGGIDQLSFEDVNYLNHICEPRVSYRELPVVGGKIRYMKMIHEDEIVVFEVM